MFFGFFFDREGWFFGACSSKCLETWHTLPPLWEAHFGMWVGCALKVNFVFWYSRADLFQFWGGFLGVNPTKALETSLQPYTYSHRRQTGLDNPTEIVTVCLLLWPVTAIITHAHPPYVFPPFTPKYQKLSLLLGRKVIAHFSWISHKFNIY